MYPVELEIKDTTKSNTSASYPDFLLSIGRDGLLHTSIYDIRDDFNFHITHFFLFLSSIIPASPAYGVFILQLIRYTRACSWYECFILRATRLSNKLLEQGYVKERLKSSLKKFLVDTGILSNNTKFLSNECLMTFCILTKYNDTFLQNSTFYRFMRGFHRKLATGVACWQGTLTPPNTWSRPIWDLHMVYLLRPILFPNLYFFFGLFTSNIPRYSWLSFS